jgi:hypothetical protein
MTENSESFFKKKKKIGSLGEPPSSRSHPLTFLLHLSSRRVSAPEPLRVFRDNEPDQRELCITVNFFCLLKLCELPQTSITSGNSEARWGNFFVGMACHNSGLASTTPRMHPAWAYSGAFFEC